MSDTGWPISEATKGGPKGLLAVAGKFKSLFETGQATDFTITCGKKSWAVHGFVLNLYSDVLACACDGNFKETAARSIDLSIDGEACVKALISYMYAFDYALDDCESEPYTTHVNMILLANKYDIQHLLKLANTKLVRILSGTPLKLTDDLVSATKLAYDAEGPTAAYREALVKAVIKSSEDDFEGYCAIIRQLPSLSQDVAIAIARGETTKLNCGHNFVPRWKRAFTTRRKVELFQIEMVLRI
nr:hypothetical protein B0A51_04247 [Rachicladosporium sp. CCFEE 5018]OQO31236.1 hypothetical protein B0A51_02077 [Rachicladosporium sp. CCFEE 5018]